VALAARGIFQCIPGPTAYRWTLQKVFRRPWLGVGLSLILPVMGFAVFATLPQQFFPPTNRDQFQIEFSSPPRRRWMPPRPRCMAARDLALKHPEVEDIHWFLGRSAPSFFYNVPDNRRNAQNYAQGIVQLNTTEHLRADHPNPANRDGSRLSRKPRCW
jgi:multidrug efflux pump subunit AcrB